MNSLIDILPSGFAWRELWLPELINGTTLPSSAREGHALTLTGARKGSTTAGVHVDGSATGNIGFGAQYNSATKLWISLRFKLDRAFAAGDTSQYLLGKQQDIDNVLWVFLNTADGKLYFSNRTGATTHFTIVSAETSWAAATWYHVLVSISDTAGARLRVNNGTAVTDADTNAAPAGGDFIVGDIADGGATGLVGTLADITVGTDNLTTNEEADLYKGVPPADAVNRWPLDEGRGSTVTDRGSGADDGTLDTGATWSFLGQPKLPALSLDGINDRGQSSSGVDISGGVSALWVGRVRNSYSSAVTASQLYFYRVDANNYIGFSWDGSNLHFVCNGGGSSAACDYSGGLTFGSYTIHIGTLTAAGAIAVYANGSQQSTGSGVGDVSVGAATAYIGTDNTPAYYDTSAPLLVGLARGALSAPQALNVSRLINQRLNLGLSI